MSLPNRIELCSGADLQLRCFLWLVWFAALITVLAHSDRVSAWLPPLCMLLLYWSLPQNQQGDWQPHHLTLYADGKAQWDQESGEWLRDFWRSRWYTAICFKSEKKTRWLWISAGNNHRDAYRQLGIWCRFSPQPLAKRANDSH